MRFISMGAAVVLAALVSGCSCSSNKITPAGAAENVPVAEAGGVVADVNFDFDSAALSPAAQSTLSQNAAWLKSHGSKSVQVEGHCDERGTNEYNLALGSRRATAAAEYLKVLGIEGSRLSTVSYGEEIPLDPAHTEEAWAKNRRAHFKVQ